MTNSARTRTKTVQESWQKKPNPTEQQQQRKRKEKRCWSVASHWTTCHCTHEAQTVHAQMLTTLLKRKPFQQLNGSLRDPCVTCSHGCPKSGSCGYWNWCLSGPWRKSLLHLMHQYRPMWWVPILQNPWRIPPQTEVILEGSHWQRSGTHGT